MKHKFIFILIFLSSIFFVGCQTDSSHNQNAAKTLQDYFDQMTVPDIFTVHQIESVEQQIHSGTTSPMSAREEVEFSFSDGLLDRKSLKVFENTSNNFLNSPDGLTISPPPPIFSFMSIRDIASKYYNLSVNSTRFDLSPTHVCFYDPHYIGYFGEKDSSADPDRTGIYFCFENNILVLVSGKRWTSWWMENFIWKIVGPEDIISNVKLCELDRHSDICFLDLAHALQDKTVCSNIKDQGIRESCSLN